MMLPLMALCIAALLAGGYYRYYLNQVSTSWEQLSVIELPNLTLDKIENALDTQLTKHQLTSQERIALADSLYRWIESQRTASLDAFLSFRFHGLKKTDLSVSESLSHYYSQFLTPDNASPSEGISDDSKPESVIESLFRIHGGRNELLFRGKRLCLGCIQGISLSSLKAEVRQHQENPLNEHMTRDNPLSMEGFTGVYEAVGPFRHLLSELTSRSKTVNVSFIVRSGKGARMAYKCGLQWVWLPQRKIWFPIELMIGYPGDRTPMEAFLF